MHGSYRLESQGKKDHFEGVPGKSGKVRESQGFFSCCIQFSKCLFQTYNFSFYELPGSKKLIVFRS